MLDSQAKAAREVFSAIQEELDNRDDLKEGLSFLDLKNDTLLSYMIDICNITRRKARGEKIEGHKSVERCVEYRVVLEKIKAIDQRLEYQLNKLITLPEDTVEEDQRIDINNLDINLEDEESDSEKGEEDSTSDEEDVEDDHKEEKNEGLYKPPKLRSVGRRKDHSEFYQDEDPLASDKRKQDELTRYEEDNYTRLPAAKRAKKKVTNKRSR